MKRRGRNESAVEGGIGCLYTRFAYSIEEVDQQVLVMLVKHDVDFPAGLATRRITSFGRGNYYTDYSF